MGDGLARHVPLRRGVGPVEILAIRWGRKGRRWLAATDPTVTTDERLEG